MEITLRQLTYLTRLHEKGSFTAAADALGITQPALSIAISQLEEALGVPMVERGTRPVALTEAGELMTACAQRVVREIKQAREEVSAMESGRIGRLDICMSPSATGTVISDVLSRMVEEFPQLEIHISHGVLPAAAERLHNGEIAVLVGASVDGLRDSALHFTPLLDVAMVAVAGPGHPLAKKLDVSLEDLTRHPWIQIGDINANLPEWSRTFARARLSPPRIAVDIRNLALVRDMLHRGKLLTVLPKPMVQADLDAGLLHSVTPPEINWRLTINAITSTIKRPPASVRIFLERLDERLAEASH
ncbi:LysR family transcriptional regulator [Altererythrobacter sp. BO-6]|uniref:LysR family transcriptional regulator n=1 Tax=Altererythrobacter sp. BO-6 TaxID=2604537 RepID=UPI0019D2A048|nr:LysR family transcriptional regulator [Altererythrobacter sp. BO-6]